MRLYLHFVCAVREAATVFSKQLYNFSVYVTLNDEELNIAPFATHGQISVKLSGVMTIRRKKYIIMKRQKNFLRHGSENPV